MNDEPIFKPPNMWKSMAVCAVVFIFSSLVLVNSPYPILSWAALFLAVCGAIGVVLLLSRRLMLTMLWLISRLRHKD